MPKTNCYKDGEYRILMPCVEDQFSEYMTANQIAEKIKSGELTLEPGFAKHKDGRLELIEISVVANRKTNEQN